MISLLLSHLVLLEQLPFLLLFLPCLGVRGVERAKQNPVTQLFIIFILSVIVDQYNASGVKNTFGFGFRASLNNLVYETVLFSSEIVHDSFKYLVSQGDVPGNKFLLKNYLQKVRPHPCFVCHCNRNKRYVLLHMKSYISFISINILFILLYRVRLTPTPVFDELKQQKRKRGHQYDKLTLIVGIIDQIQF